MPIDPEVLSNVPKELLADYLVEVLDTFKTQQQLHEATAIPLDKCADIINLKQLLTLLATPTSQ